MAGFPPKYSAVERASCKPAFSSTRTAVVYASGVCRITRHAPHATPAAAKIARLHHARYRVPRTSISTNPATITVAASADCASVSFNRNRRRARRIRSSIISTQLDYLLHARAVAAVGLDIAAAGRSPDFSAQIRSLGPAEAFII